MSAASESRMARSQAALSTRRLLLRPNLVIVAALFNLVLCFLNTRNLLNVSNSEIILVEFLILTAGLYAVWEFVSPAAIQLTAILAVYLAGLKLINPALDFKILHDIAIMYLFYLLGTRRSIEEGNQTLWIIMLIVLAVGAFEFIAPVVFGNVFNVWSYYVNKGVIGPGTVDYSHSNLFISGNRGAAAVRTFFPSIFGPHRVSSIFLEPDSLGNFAVIAFSWCLSTKTGRFQWQILMFALAALCIVLADSRFAAICCVVMLLFRQTMFLRRHFVVFLLPVLVMFGLVIVGSVNPMPGDGLPSIIYDDFAGRLLFSGRLLASWGWQQWLGLAGSPVYTADTGYAYVVNNLGLPVSLFLLMLFSLKRQANSEASWMKFLMSIYFAASLCIGASVFTIKTAALVWFLYGTTAAQRRPRQPAAASLHDGWEPIAFKFVPPRLD